MGWSLGLLRLLVALAAGAVMLASFALVSQLFARNEPGETAAPAAAAPGAPEAVAPPPPAGTPTAADAGLSWEDAARAAEQREQVMRDRILALSGSDDTTIDYKLDRYLQALRETFEGTAQAHVLEDRSMLTEAFLRMESVQRDLASLSPGARRQELARIRREMGFSEDQVAELAEMDDHREARWQRGLAYMEERRRILDTFDGEAREAELRALRERVFAHEAKTIALEEEQGFFRYERPRIYGRN